MRIWSDVEYVYRCLADEERTRAFKAAIHAVVHPGSVVLDLGTGSGIMALFAARAGASRIYAVEIGDYLFRSACRTFEASPYSSVITPLCLDARGVSLEAIEKPDVVICEMITTGLIGEMQGPVINALRRAGVIDAHTALIPSGLSTRVSLVEADFSFFGEELRFPIFVDYFTRSFQHRHAVLSEERLAHQVKFSAPFEENVRISQDLILQRPGLVNGILLTSTTSFGHGRELGSCSSYCQPVILPILGLDVKAGDVVSVLMEYQMGEGFDSLESSVSHASRNSPLPG